jgi:hypothetical protein
VLLVSRVTVNCSLHEVWFYLKHSDHSVWYSLESWGLTVCHSVSCMLTDRSTTLLPSITVFHEEHKLWNPSLCSNPYFSFCLLVPKLVLFSTPIWRDVQPKFIKLAFPLLNLVKNVRVTCFLNLTKYANSVVQSEFRFLPWLYLPGCESTELVPWYLVIAQTGRRMGFDIDQHASIMVTLCCLSVERRTKS